MAGKRAAGPNSGRKGGAAASSEPVAAPGAGARKSSRGKQNAWPWWLWVVGAFGLLVSMGRLIATDSSGEGKGRAGRAAKSGSKVSASRYLELALRLQEMTELATALTSGNALDKDAARELDKELTSIEGELEGEEGTTSRDLRSMVSVVRGTLYQNSDSLTDEQVEGLSGNSFTYANPRYWDDYYNKTSSAEKYDWYGTWDSAVVAPEFTPKGADSARKADTVGDLLRPYLDPESKILMFGCGNSDMSEKMYAAGFESIVNIDISEKLLQNLRERLGKSMPRMSWMHMNASEMTFSDASFDIVIDKGTLDAIEGNKPLLQAAAAETHRVLRPGGYLLSVTFNSAPLRVEGQLRKAADWADCLSHTFSRSGGSSSDERGYFVHACQKRSL